LLARFYLMMGNALDELGRGKESIDVYEFALKQEPQSGPLHYNLAVSLNHAGKKREAKAESEKAVQYQPEHASNHLLLAQLYQDLGYRIPAIFAYSQFLLLEPDSPRAGQVLPILQNLITGGVRQGKDPKTITILLSNKSPADEGDFGPTEAMMSILVAADVMGDKTPKPSSAFDRLVSVYSSIGESLKNAKPKGGFAAKYYAPYFAALVEAGHTEAFVAAAWSGGNVDGTAAWINANRSKLEAFENWLKSYRWPAP
jgi:tetratricopeptide (TPR) repeat protein